MDSYVRRFLFVLVLISLFLFKFRWCVLFSHPSDFTPVCTTELGKMAVLVDEFTKRNVKVLGLSCDKLESHVDWINVMP